MATGPFVEEEDAAGGVDGRSDPGKRREAGHKFDEDRMAGMTDEIND